MFLNRYKYTIISLLFLSVLAVNSSASVIDGEEVESVIPMTDSLEFADTVVIADTVTYQRTDELRHFASVDDQTNFERELTQQPTIALVKSMVIPGFGQYGNKRIVKGLFFLTLDVWFVSSAIRYKGLASDFRDSYEQETSITLRNNFYEKFEEKRDQRNKFTWFAVIVTFISMFDAYADAHLSGFPIKPDGEGLGFMLEQKEIGVLSASLILNF